MKQLSRLFNEVEQAHNKHFVIFGRDQHSLLVTTVAMIWERGLVSDE